MPLSICVCIISLLLAACGNVHNADVLPETAAIEETESSPTPPAASAESAEETIRADEETGEQQSGSIVENPTQVIEDPDEWELTDILTNAVPEDARYHGATEHGFFFSRTVNEYWTYVEESKFHDRDDNYYFYSWDGQITCVFEHKDIKEYFYSLTDITDSTLLIFVQDLEGVTAYQVYEDGRTEELYQQTNFTVPARYITDDYFYFTQDDLMADGREVRKVLRWNRDTSETDVIYQTECDSNGDGRLVCRIGGTDEEIFLAVKGYKNTENGTLSDWHVVKLDPDTGTVLAEIEEPYGILNVGGSGNRVLIAENSSEVPLPESGKIYMWEDSLSSAVPIPGWTASNHVWFSMLSGSRMLMYSAENGYIWDLETDRFHIADFSKLLETSKVGMSSEGFSGLVLQEDGMHWREIRLIQ